MTLFTVGTLGITQGAYKLATVRRRRSPPIARLRPQELTLSSLLPPSLPPSPLDRFQTSLRIPPTVADHSRAIAVQPGREGGSLRKFRAKRTPRLPEMDRKEN